MKKFFKIIPCIMVSALAFTCACACRNGVSDIRRRARQLEERVRKQEQRLLEDEEPEQLDPDFSVEPQNETEEEEKKEKNPDNGKCPDCPDHSDERPHSELLPERGGHHGKRIKPKPVPLPVPPEEPEN